MRLERFPDESTVPRFRHFLEKHKLVVQILAIVKDMLIDKGLLLNADTVVDATLIATPRWTKSAIGDAWPRDASNPPEISSLEYRFRALSRPRFTSTIYH